VGEQHQPEVGRSRRGAIGLLTTLIVGAAMIPPNAPVTVVAATSAGRPTEAAGVPTSRGPRLIDGDVAATLVLVRGGAVCSGTPITGTRYVATAAHCVLDLHGRPARRTVVRDGATHRVTAVWVDTRYVDEPTPRFDAAILELDHHLPGPSATIGPQVPTDGSATIAGYQPVDVDGTPLRGEGPHDRPPPRTRAGHLVLIDSLPAGCTASVDDIAVTAARVDVPCGLIPGASGGGLFVRTAGAIVLVGIISTVAYDLSSNGVVPLASLAALLRQPARYRYPTDALTSPGDSVEVARR
jgi:hypothetical protein